MNILKLGIFLLIISFISCLVKREIFAENIRNYFQTINWPAKADELVSNFQNKLTLLFYTLTLKELKEVQVKYDLSDSLMLQIKAVQFSKSSGIQKIEEQKNLNQCSYEKTLGAALKENDNLITFALIKSKSFAKLKTQYQTYYTKECHRVWIFFKKCYDEERQRERGLLESEKIIIKEAAKYSAISSISEACDILKKGDYELYMSDTGSIFSPDQKSVAHVTYFGNIAIGPTSELNAILPIDYEYQFNSNGNNGGHLIKNAVGNITELKNYPSIKKGFMGISYRANFIIKKGYFHKYKFLVKNKLTKFPGEYLYSMVEESEKGPFVLEVKKNGNVLLYPKNNPNNPLWTTNTANKGIGPYNLHLTNEKKLILEDSTGKILYESDDYKEAPTVFYGSNGEKGNHISNGYVLNKPTSNLFHLMTDNIKYEINYKALYENVRKSSEYELGRNSKKGPVNLFSASISNDDFDICYTAKLNNEEWSSIACNGDYVGYMPAVSDLNYETNYRYIENLVIYIKEKGEIVPYISDIPAVSEPPSSKVIHFEDDA